MTVPKDIKTPLGATGSVSPAECATMIPRDSSGWCYGSKRKGGVDISRVCGVTIVVKRGLAGEKQKTAHRSIPALYCM